MKKQSCNKKKERQKKLYYHMREEMYRKWHRVLPFGDLLGDRWEKAEFLHFGQGSNIYDSSVVMGDVQVGENTWIGPFTLLDGSGGILEIGDCCSISSGVQIYTHDTVNYCVSGGKQQKECKAVSIGNNCYIGPMAIISKGVKLGNRCIVGANSFVNKSFGDCTIIAGTPAKAIGKVVVNSDGSIQRIYYKKETRDE